MQEISKLLQRINNKKMLIIFPHPDDESYSSAGLILIAKNLGFEVILVTLTQGGAGKIAINPKGKSIRQIRVIELKNAKKLLGIDKAIIKDYDDSKLKKRNGWSKFVAKKILEEKPGIIVTYDQTGLSGHPDHIVLSLFIKDFLRRHRVKTTLLWPALQGKLQEFIPIKIRNFAPKPQYINNLSFQDTIRKINAILKHKSQKNGQLNKFLLATLISRKEWYHKVDLDRKYPFKYIDFEI